MKKYILLIAMAALTAGYASAQDNVALQAKELPQALHLNPAARPSKSFLSVPLVGSFSLGASNPFSINQIIDVQSTGSYLNLQAMSNLSGTTPLLMTSDWDIANMGFYLSDEDFLQVSVRARSSASTTHPSGLYDFLSSSTLGTLKQYDISFTPDVLGWGEVGVGYSRSIDDNFTVGARLKYLMGFIGVQSPTGVNFSLNQNYDQYLVSGNYTMNLGGLSLANSDGKMNYFVSPFENSGLAADIGMTYVSDSEEFTASFSVSDFGAIWWNGDGATQLNVKNPGAQYDFKGAGNLLGSRDITFVEVLDSLFVDLNNTIGLDTLKGASFSTPLPTTIQAMGSYALGDELEHNLSLGFIGAIPTRGDMRYSVTAGYAYRSPNDVWQLMCNYSYRWDNPVNIGVGAVMTTGNFQMYLSTNNVISLFSPNDARNVNFNLGINIFFGD